MPIGHHLQGGQVRFQPLPSIECVQNFQQVGVTFFCHDVMEQDAFLQGGQGVNVLHIACTASDAGDNLFDLLRCQGDQCQHFWCDLCASRRDQVGRCHNCLVLILQFLREFSHRGGFEDRADLGVQPCPPHSLNQHYGQQGVTAQLEAVVVNANPIELHDSCPVVSEQWFGGHA